MRRRLGELLEADSGALRPTTAADEAFERLLHGQTDQSAGFLPDDVRPALLDMQFLARRRAYADAFPNADTYIIEQAGQALGRLVVDLSTQPLRIVDLAVLVAHQGAGIGTAIISAVMQLAIEHDTVVVLTVSVTNPRAQHLYARLGFVSTDATNTDISMESRRGSGSRSHG